MKKIKILFRVAFVALFFASATVYASFPVKNHNNESTKVANTNDGGATIQTNESITKIEAKDQVNNTQKTNSLDEKWILVLLWFFLGGVAAHRWYKKKPVLNNILFIITLGGCGIWSIIDLVNILTDNF